MSEFCIRFGESILKRGAGVKDSSPLFAGHGGVLDRFDFVYSDSAFFLLLLDFFPNANLTLRHLPIPFSKNRPVIRTKAHDHPRFHRFDRDASHGCESRIWRSLPGGRVKGPMDKSTVSWNRFAALNRKCGGMGRGLGTTDSGSSDSSSRTTPVVLSGLKGLMDLASWRGCELCRIGRCWDGGAPAAFGRPAGRKDGCPGQQRIANHGGRIGHERS